MARLSFQIFRITAWCDSRGWGLLMRSLEVRRKFGVKVAVLGKTFWLRQTHVAEEESKLRQSLTKSGLQICQKFGNSHFN